LILQFQFSIGETLGIASTTSYMRNQYGFSRIDMFLREPELISACYSHRSKQLILDRAFICRWVDL